MHRSQSLSEDPVLRLVAHIYDGAVDPNAWPDIVQHLASFFSASKAGLFTAFVGPDKGGLSLSYGVPDAALQVWGARYIPHDIWAQTAVAKGLLREGNAVLDCDLLSEQEFLQTVIYREHLQHLDVTKLCSGIVFGAESSDLPPTLVCVYRGRTDPPFGEEDRALMQILISHFSRALGVMYRLRDAEVKIAANLAALDRLGSGVILLDTRGNVVHANGEADRTFAKHDGLSLASGRHQHRTRSLAAEDAFAQAEIETWRSWTTTDGEQPCRRNCCRPFILAKSC